MEAQVIKKYKQFTKLINKTYSIESSNVPFARNNDGSINYTHSNVNFKLIPPLKVTYDEAKNNEKSKWIKETFEINKKDELNRIKELLSKTKNRKEYLELQKEKYELQTKIYNDMMNKNWETSHVWGSGGDTSSKLRMLYRPLTGHHFNKEDVKGKWDVLIEDDKGNLYEEIEVDYDKLYENCKKFKKEGIGFSDKNMFTRLENNLKLPPKTLDDYTIYIKDLYNSIELAKDVSKDVRKDLSQDIKKKMIKKDKPVKESKIKDSQKEPKPEPKPEPNKKTKIELKKKCTNRNPEPNSNGVCPKEKPYKRDGCCYKTKKNLKIGGWLRRKRNIFTRYAPRCASPCASPCAPPCVKQKVLVWKDVRSTSGHVISPNVGCATSNDVYDKLGFEEIKLCN